MIRRGLMSMMKRQSVFAVACPRVWMSSGTPTDLKTIFTLQNVSKQFHIPGKEPRVLFEDFSMQIFDGTKIGLIGPNGAGKSSFLKLFKEYQQEGLFEGTAYASKGVNVGYLEQEPKLDETKNVYENVTQDVSEKIALVSQLDKISEAFSDPEADFEELSNRQAEILNAIEEHNVWNLMRKVETAMQCLNCPDPESPVKYLSGGEKRRVALARLIISDSKLLVLDEPTNHLDAQSVSWLEMYLKHFNGAVIAITHDRYFLDNVATVIMELENGRMAIHTGNYSSWLERKTERMESSKKKNEGIFRRMKKELQQIKDDQANIAKRVTKSRKQSYEDLVQQYEKSSVKDRIASGKLLIPSGERLGDKVISLSGLEKSFDGRTLFSKLSLTIGAGEIIGIVGKNGCGKSSLFRILTGTLQPDKGKVEFGSTVSLGYADQGRSFTSEEHSLIEEISEGNPVMSINGQEFNVRTYIAQFNFREEAQEKLMKNLSGGERNRVHLAKLLKNRHNVLMFDEPTNDLDIETLRSLEEGLVEFPGTSIIISHDRWFLDRICNRVLVFEDDGTVNFFDGNYSKYLASRGKSTSFKCQESSAKAATYL